METDVSKPSSACSPCKCNVYDCIITGLYLTASLICGIIVSLMAIDKSVYGQCRLVSYMNVTGDYFDFDVEDTHEVCDAVWYFMLFVLCFGFLSFLLHWPLGLQGLNCWAIFQAVACSITTVLMIAYSCLITEQLFMFCAAFHHFHDDGSPNIRSCWDKVRDYEKLHLDSKDLHLLFFKGSLTVILTTAWSLSLVWMGLTMLQAGRACHSITRLRINKAQKNLNKNDSQRISDFDTNLNSSYKTFNSETQPLLGQGSNYTPDKLEQGDRSPFLRALNSP